MQNTFTTPVGVHTSLLLLPWEPGSWYQMHAINDIFVYCVNGDIVVMSAQMSEGKRGGASGFTFADEARCLDESFPACLRLLLFGAQRRCQCLHFVVHAFHKTVKPFLVLNVRQALLRNNHHPDQGPKLETF